MSFLKKRLLATGSTLNTPDIPPEDVQVGNWGIPTTNVPEVRSGYIRYDNTTNTPVLTSTNGEIVPANSSITVEDPNGIFAADTERRRRIAEENRVLNNRYSNYRGSINGVSQFPIKDPMTGKIIGFADSAEEAADQAFNYDRNQRLYGNRRYYPEERLPGAISLEEYLDSPISEFVNIAPYIGGPNAALRMARQASQGNMPLLGDILGAAMPAVRALRPFGKPIQDGIVGANRLARGRNRRAAQEPNPTATSSTAPAAPTTNTPQPTTPPPNPAPSPTPQPNSTPASSSAAQTSSSTRVSRYPTNPRLVQRLKQKAARRIEEREQAILQERRSSSSNTSNTSSTSNSGAVQPYKPIKEPTGRAFRRHKKNMARNLGIDPSKLELQWNNHIGAWKYRNVDEGGSWNIYNVSRHPSLGRRTFKGLLILGGLGAVSGGISYGVKKANDRDSIPDNLSSDTVELATDFQ